MSQAALQHRSEHYEHRARRDGNAEARSQAAMVAWVGWVCAAGHRLAIPNGGLRSKSEAARMKWTGALAACLIWCSCCREASSASGRSRPRTAAPQRRPKRDAHPRLEMRGHVCAVVRSIDDARVELVTAWGSRRGRRSRDRAPPTLTQQIAAVEAAARHYLIDGRAIDRTGDELEAVFAALEAAAETLRTLDFGRETLR